MHVRFCKHTLNVLYCLKKTNYFNFDIPLDITTTQWFSYSELSIQSWLAVYILQLHSGLAIHSELSIQSWLAVYILQLHSGLASHSELSIQSWLAVYILQLHSGLTSHSELSIQSWLAVFILQLHSGLASHSELSIQSWLAVYILQLHSGLASNSELSIQSWLAVYRYSCAQTHLFLYFVCVFACLHPMNVKKAEPIGPKVCETTHMTLGKDHGCSKLHKRIESESADK